MTNTHTQNFLGRCLTFLQNNTTVLIAATIAGNLNLFSLIGLMADVAQLTEFISSKPKLKPEWVLVKVTGWSVGYYNNSNELKGTSKLTSMIYTDYKVTDNDLDNARYQKKDFSVLKNVDYVGRLPGDSSETFKRNSQTIQARLIQASKNEEPVCLRVYGKRNNNKSQFFNIVKFKTVKPEIQPEIQKEYDELKNKNHSDTQYQELIQRACPNS
jgi:hypothetical protein